MSGMVEYVSREVRAVQVEGGLMVERIGTLMTPFLLSTERHTEAWAIMVEIGEEHRRALGLPGCGALTGGTALCLARRERVKSGEVPLPSAPTCWDELAAAEVWPMAWLGAHEGLQVKIVLPDEQ